VDSTPLQLRLVVRGPDGDARDRSVRALERIGYKVTR
jgi:hypothetical protein